MSGATRTTRVTIFDLHPSGGGPPAVVFQTTAANDQEGKPHDIAIAPNGRFAAVRSDMEVGLYELADAASGQRWLHRLHGDPGTFAGYALDSIEVTNTRVATISRIVATAGTQLDVFDVTGRQRWAELDGQPHDLALTPTRDRVAVRSRSTVALFDIADLGPPGVIAPLDTVDFDGPYWNWNAGLDSIVAAEDRVAAISRQSNDATDTAVWDISEDRLEEVFRVTHDDDSLDLEVSPGGERVIFGYLRSFLVVDLRTGAPVLAADGTTFGGSYTWCDSVAIDETHAAAFGVGAVNGQGWISLIDLFEQPERYCPANPSSSGKPGELVASGSASIGSNDLVLWASSLPSDAIGIFVYGDARVQVPFGDGFLCVGGQLGRFPPARASDGGVATRPIDYANLPPSGGTIVPGTTWHFQHLFRDAGTGAFNSTDALSIAFGN